MEHTLPDLPYAMDALEPHISKETLEYHYGKHHQAYVTNLNKLIEGTEFAEESLEDIIRTSSGGVFNNAAQIWNHTFYWNCLSPHGGGEPTGALAQAITEKWRSFDQFKTEFTQCAVTTFGSGWAWLVRTSHGDLDLVSTSNAATPLTTANHRFLPVMYGNMPITLIIATAVHIMWILFGSWSTGLSLPSNFHRSLLLYL